MKLKKILQIFFLNIAIFVLFVMSMELLVRIFFPSLTLLGSDGNLFENNKFNTSYGFKSNIKGTIFEKSFKTNAWGFREDSTLESQNKPKQAILLLGDSIAFALGSESKNSYSFLLEEKFKKYHIINTAVPGYGLEDYYNVLENLIHKIEFVGIIVSVCLDDFTLRSQTFIKENFSNKERAKKLIPNKFLYFLINFNNKIFDFNSFLGSHFKTYLLIRNLSLDVSKICFDAEYLNYLNQEFKDRISSDLLKLSDLAAKNKKWIVFVVFPYEYQLRNYVNENVFLPQKIIDDCAKINSIQLIDLYPHFKKYIVESKIKPSSLYLLFDPMHFSKSGNILISKFLYDELFKSNLIDCNL